MNIKKSKGKCTKAIMISAICSLLVFSMLSPSKMLAKENSCVHPSPKITGDSERVFSKDINSYCVSIMEYVHYHCNECGAEWSTTNNIATEPHNWNEVSCTRTNAYTHSSNAHCYMIIEAKTFQCSKCGITKGGSSVIGSAVPHSWREKVDHFDGTYTHLYKECDNCGCRVFSRKVKGPVEITLQRSIIKKEQY